MNRRTAGILLLLLGALCVAGFFAADHLLGGFEQQGRYGDDPVSELNWTQKIPPRQWQLFGAMLVLGVPAILCFAAGFARTGIADKIARAARPAFLKSSGPRFAIAVAAAVFAVTQLVSSLALQHAAIADDEQVYRLQAGILATGHLTAPSHPLREFFDNVFVINDGRVYGQYPFGHPALLSLGVLAGRPSLVPSLLAALSAVLLFGIARRISDETTARLATLLLAFSPWFLATSSTLLSQTSALAGYLLCLLLAIVATESGKARHLFFAGLAAGLALHIRPGEAVIWCGTALLVPVVRRAHKDSLWRTLGWIVLGGIGPVIAMGTINWLLNGSPLVNNYTAYLMGGKPHIPGFNEQAAHVLARLSPLGFGEILWGMHHSPARAVINTLLNSFRANLWLFGLAVSLLPVAAGLLARPWPKWFVPMLLSAAAAATLYFFYFWPGVSDTGPVHFFNALPLLCLASAHGIVHLARTRLGAQKTIALAAASAIVALFTFHQVQWRALSHLSWDLEEPYRVIERQAEKPAVVFFGFHVKPESPKGWRAGRKNNSLDFDGEVLYALDLGDEANRRLTAAMPGRHAYRFRYEGERPVLIDLQPDAAGGAGKGTTQP